jgi:hypothetical protein
VITNYSNNNFHRRHQTPTVPQQASCYFVPHSTLLSNTGNGVQNAHGKKWKESVGNIRRKIININMPHVLLYQRGKINVFNNNKTEGFSMSLQLPVSVH